MNAENGSLLQIRAVTKAFTPGEPVVAAVDLDVNAGEIVCLLGPSGCGKTTLLRIIAGLETPDRGDIRYQGRDLVRVPVHAREFGLMFQDFALFPHKSVSENVAFGLRMANAPKRAIAARVDEMLTLVNLDGYADRSIFELSGGERQRVALARSLAPSPGLLMLDEPLGALDRRLREELMTELRGILKRVGVTALYVTHDQQEAFAVADRIVVMNRGHVEQIGTPQMVHDQPVSAFVARFLGYHNLLPAEVTPASDYVQIDTAIGRVNLPVGGLEETHWRDRPGASTLLVRPEAARFVDESFLDDGENNRGNLLVRGRVTTSSFRGSYYRVTVNVTTDNDAQAEVNLTFDIPAYRLIVIGERQPIAPATLVPGAQLSLALDATLMTLL